MAASNVVCRVEGLAFRHERGGSREVNNVTFALRAGRTFGILGGNECGKTTLAHLLLGNLAPEAGAIELLGERAAAHAAVTARWLVVARVTLGACIAVTLLLYAVRPALLVLLLRSGVWALPCLLLLLEGAARAHARWWTANGGAHAANTESGWASAAMLARGVAYISSEHDAGQKLAADRTIEEIIAQHMPLPKAAKEARRREVRAALTAAGFQMMHESGTPIGSPEQYLNDGLKVGELSGGQRHLVYMLSVLASRPRLLVCDDCLCGLDIDRQSSMLQLLQKLQLTFGMAILYMTVDLTSFTLMAHDSAFMKHGKFIETAPAHDLVETPQRRDTQEYVRLSLENEERSHGKNLRNAYQRGESVFQL